MERFTLEVHTAAVALSRPLTYDTGTPDSHIRSDQRSPTSQRLSPSDRSTPLSLQHGRALSAYHGAFYSRSLKRSCRLWNSTERGPSLTKVLDSYSERSGTRVLSWGAYYLYFSDYSSSFSDWLSPGLMYPEKL